MLKVTLTGSLIGQTKSQRATVEALGLGKIGSSAIHADGDCVAGMIRKVAHLVSVEELKDPVEAKE